MNDEGFPLSEGRKCGCGSGLHPYTINGIAISVQVCTSCEQGIRDFVHLPRMENKPDNRHEKRQGC